MISLQDLCNDVNVSLLLTTYRKSASKIEEETTRRFRSLLTANQNALGAILAIMICCASNEEYPSLDTSGSNQRDALVFKIMVHVGSVPSLGTSICDLISHGHYFVACPLLRVLREHAAKAAFYSSFPQEAMQHLKKGGRRDDNEVQLTAMKKKLNWDSASETRTSRYLNKFTHADPLAGYSKLMLPSFDEKLSYTLFVITALELRVVLHALGKAFQPKILSNLSLANVVSSSMDAIVSIENNLDRNLLQLRSIDNLR